MIDEFKALYHASLQTDSHSAFYRYPLQNIYHGVISQNLCELTNEREGFIIRPFGPHLKPQLIENQIGVQFTTALTLNIPHTTNYTEAFLESYHSFLNAPTKTYPSTYYKKTASHEASQTEYIEAIQKSQLEMQRGHFKKVVLSRITKIKYTQTSPVIDLFFSLCAKYPKAFISLISSANYGTWLGASPEVLVHQQAENYTTVALAGTKKSSDETLFSSKEAEEQNIIKEYIENSLALQNIKSESSAREDFDTGGLTHLKTSIYFTAPASSRLTIAEALHPTPAVGGYPKNNAVDFILENEHYDREIYAGYIGAINKEELNLYVNIRCMQWLPEYALLYAGAGITMASKAEAEWEETENKRKIISDVL
ncbi:MAG: isochorismate synthase [Bacteroidetes bacterium]|nr:isochorismate synthase [Bacteroidota bacterium]